MADPEGLWGSFLETLREQVSDGTWRAWFEGISALSVSEQQMVLAVPNVYMKERLEGRFRPMLEDAADAVGLGGRPIELVVQRPDGNAGASPDGVVAGGAAADTASPDGAVGDGGPAGRRAATPRPAAQPERLLRDQPSEVPINGRYVFDTFVIGTSNRFAHAAALSVAEAPGQSYNPLFIYGEAGLGKTHLLHAIGNYIRAHFAARQVRYFSVETFMNDFIAAIRTNTTHAFKHRYRESHVLLVDDMQFLENKEGTQEEFFHTFNTIRDNGGQIVITCDRHPKALETLADRLRSRFLSGLITDVQPPDLETRLAILHKKADYDGLDVSEEALQFIATNVKHNIRELEGALLRLSAYASLNREPASLDLARLVLADIVSSDEPRPITPDVILQATAKTFGFTVEELRGASRRRPLVTARQIGMYVFRQMTDFSYPAIAREFGGRDHTTVMHAYDKISALMGERRHIYDQVTELMANIRKGMT